MTFLGRMLLVFCVVEGIASLARVAALFAARAERPLAERLHTEYDPELGWVNRPKVSLPDLYGPGASLHTNAQRFRGARDVTRVAPPGRVRAICSGDSFALGYGVDDDARGWHQLETLEPRLETVNMGQGGYGKPRLRLDGDVLAVDNVPVPRTGYWVPWLAQNAHFAGELRSIQMLRGVARRFGTGAPAARATNADIPALAAAWCSSICRCRKSAVMTPPRSCVLSSRERRRGRVSRFSMASRRCEQSHRTRFPRCSWPKPPRTFPLRPVTTRCAGTAGWRSGCSTRCARAACWVLEPAALTL